MKIKATNNSPNFKAWDKAAKSILSKAIAELPNKLQNESIEVVNQLEHNSTRHTLSYSDKLFRAISNTISGENYYSQAGNFRKGLKKLQKFISRQNIEVPQIEQCSKQIENLLKKFADNNIFKSGLRFPELDLQHVSTSIAKDLHKKRKVSKLSEITRLLEEIDKKAQATRTTVTLTPYRGYHITRLTLDIESNQDKINLKTLKRIDKKLDKLAKTIKYEEAKEDKSFKKDLKKIKDFETKEHIISSIKNSKVYKILYKIKSTIFEPFDKIKQANAEKIRKEQSIIAEKLDI